ncbi:MAG: hypothetical protein KAT70_02400 [Thermoplasmata archaeon]|nr:hypothetical protein [Thermoplasmata archaeon]
MGVVRGKRNADHRRGGGVRKVVVISTLSILALVMLSPLLSAYFPLGAPACDSCHSNRDWLGLDLDAPAEVPTDSSFAVVAIVTVDNGLDSADDISVTIDLSQAGDITLKEGESATKTVPAMDGGGESRVSWDLRSGQEKGEGTIQVSIQGTIHFQHRPTTNADDDGACTGVSSTSITVGEEFIGPGVVASGSGKLGIPIILAMLLALPLLLFQVRTLAGGASNEERGERGGGKEEGIDARGGSGEGKAREEGAGDASPGIKALLNDRILSTLILAVGILEAIILATHHIGLDASGAAWLVPLATIFAGWVNPNMFMIPKLPMIDDIRPWSVVAMCLVGLAYMLVNGGLVW